MIRIIRAAQLSGDACTAFRGSEHTWLSSLHFELCYLSSCRISNYLICSNAYRDNNILYMLKLFSFFFSLHYFYICYRPLWYFSVLSFHLWNSVRATNSTFRKPGLMFSWAVHLCSKMAVIRSDEMTQCPVYWLKHIIYWSWTFIK